MDERIPEVRDQLLARIQQLEHKGVDPYDILRSPFPFEKLGKWPSVLATQFQKRSPLNLRPLLGIHPTLDPKAIGLALDAYCRMINVEGRSELKSVADELFQTLLKLRSEGPRGDAWGYPFPWYNPQRSLPPFSPNIVVTGTVARALYKYQAMSGSREAWESLERISTFMVDELPRSEDATGICFSYTTVQKDRCYNASLIGAEHLARMYRSKGEEREEELVRRAVDFVLARQYPTGRWNYSEDPRTGKERVQIDHHQGFVIDSLRRIHHHAFPEDEHLLNAIKKGLHFYRKEQFFDEGRSMWRLPKKWPVDIHSQAQGIITFDLNRDLDPSYGPFAERIAEWTIAHMQGKDGAFYYRITPLFKNRIRYMRWGQAWMLLALSKLRTGRSSSAPFA